MAKIKFIPTALDKIKPTLGRPRIYYAEGDIRGFGLQVTPAGTKSFLLVYVAKATGVERRMMIGEYGPAPGLSISAAKARAVDIRAAVNAGRDPWLELKLCRAEAEAKAAKSTATFAGLLDAYIDQLRSAGKPSADEVAGSIRRNIVAPFPKVARLHANGVTVDDVMPAFHRLTKSGKFRAAEKLAVYLRAAYSAAKASRTDASGFAFKDFNIKTNPMLELKVTRQKTSAVVTAEMDQQRKTVLSADELQRYWRRIAGLNTAEAALLRFHALSGGQRMEQLCRATDRDLDLAAGTVTLWDGKGRRKVARKHLLPLLPQAVAALATMRPEPAQGEFLVTVSRGKTPTTPATLAKHMKRTSNAMLKAGEVKRAFTPGTIRRTVETLLGDCGVARDVRAQLASHGLGGVQERHYDAGTYLRQKREALNIWLGLLDPDPRVVAVTTQGSGRTHDLEESA